MTDRSSIEHSEARLLDAKTLGETLCVSERQVFRLKSAGLLPKPLQLSGSVRWLSTEIQAWLKSGAVDTATWEAMKMQAESN